MPTELAESRLRVMTGENRAREFRPLRVLGNALIVLLVGTVVAAAGTLLVPLAERSAPAWVIATDVKPFKAVSRALFVIAAVAFLVWLRRGRIIAESSGWLPALWWTRFTLWRCWC